MIKFLIKGDPKTKKNSQRIVNRGKFSKILPSKISMKYEKEGIKQLKEQLPEDFKTIDYPVNVKAIYYRKTKRVVDVSNLTSALHDILTGAGVLEDDSFYYIESTDGSRVRFDKDNPRTEIYITKAEGSTAAQIIKDEELAKIKKREDKKKAVRERKEKAYILRTTTTLTFKEIGEEIGVSQSTASKYYKEIKKEKGDGEHED